VRTSKFCLEEQDKGDRVRGLYTMAKGGVTRNAGRSIADSANTHAVYQGDRLLALSDAGRPWEIDPDDLSTLGRCDFDGRLPKLARMGWRVDGYHVGSPAWVGFEMQFVAQLTDQGRNSLVLGYGIFAKHGFLPHARVRLFFECGLGAGRVNASRR